MDTNLYETLRTKPLAFVVAIAAFEAGLVDEQSDDVEEAEVELPTCPVPPEEVLS